MHEVLEDLVDHVAHVDVAVGVGRAVVQDVQRGALAGRADLLVDLLLGPVLTHLGLSLHQVRLHGEAGFRQVHRIFITVLAFIRHFRVLENAKKESRIIRAAHGPRQGRTPTLRREMARGSGPNKKGLPEFAALEGLGSTRYSALSGQLSPLPIMMIRPIAIRPACALNCFLSSSAYPLFHNHITAFSTIILGCCQARV